VTEADTIARTLMANSRERLAIVLYALIAALFLGLLIAEYRRAGNAHGPAHSSLERRVHGRNAALASELQGATERNARAVPSRSFDV
jgi:hypothetical protein